SHTTTTRIVSPVRPSRGSRPSAAGYTLGGNGSAALPFVQTQTQTIRPDGTTFGTMTRGTDDHTHTRVYGQRDTFAGAGFHALPKQEPVEQTQEQLTGWTCRPVIPSGTQTPRAPLFLGCDGEYPTELLSAGSEGSYVAQFVGRLCVSNQPTPSLSLPPALQQMSYTCAVVDTGSDRKSIYVKLLNGQGMLEPGSEKHVIAQVSLPIDRVGTETVELPFTSQDLSILVRSVRQGPSGSIREQTLVPLQWHPLLFSKRSDGARSSDSNEISIATLKNRSQLPYVSPVEPQMRFAETGHLQRLADFIASPHPVSMPKLKKQLGIGGKGEGERERVDSMKNHYIAGSDVMIRWRNNCSTDFNVHLRPANAHATVSVRASGRDRDPSSEWTHYNMDTLTADKGDGVTSPSTTPSSAKHACPFVWKRERAADRTEGLYVSPPTTYVQTISTVFDPAMLRLLRAVAPRPGSTSCIKVTQAWHAVLLPVNMPSAHSAPLILPFSLCLSIPLPKGSGAAPRVPRSGVKLASTVRPVSARVTTRVPRSTPSKGRRLPKKSSQPKSTAKTERERRVSRPSSRRRSARESERESEEEEEESLGFRDDNEVGVVFGSSQDEAQRDRLVHFRFPPTRVGECVSQPLPVTNHTKGAIMVCADLPRRQNHPFYGDKTTFRVPAGLSFLLPVNFRPTSQGEMKQVVELKAYSQSSGQDAAVGYMGESSGIDRAEIRALCLEGMGE
ncbi:hypothetical protein KIPB_003132, partial [Kipferlia bialata]